MDRRKRLRLRGFDYGTPGVYFVTVCTRGRRCVLGRVHGAAVLLSATGRIVARALAGIDVFHPGVGLDVSVVMPNHVHAIVLLDRALGAPSLPVVVGAFKARASRRAGEPLWQRGFHDRIVRDEQELDALREYVLWNPLRWELDGENPERRSRSAGSRAG